MARRYTSTRQNHADIYVRDEELFARQMLYTYSTYTRYATPCCYCGDPATVKDHVFPIAAWGKMHFWQQNAIPRKLLKIVPACWECNSISGGMVFFSFEEKLVFIKSKIAEKYRHVLHLPPWSDDEMDELQGGLERYVRGGQTMREVLLERLRY